MVINGTSYLPVRAIGEALGSNVNYNGASKRIDIVPKNQMVSSSQIALVANQADRTELNTEQLATRATSCVYLEALNPDGELVSTASGVFITNDGIFVTNFHAISGISLTVTTQDGNKYSDIDLVGWDPGKDLALFKIPGVTSIGLPIASELPALGSSVVAIGSPMGLVNSVSSGIISGFPKLDLTYIQTSAAISPGSSGGALLNKYGEIVGITTSKVTGGENLNLALSYTDLRSVVAFLEKNPGMFGTIRNEDSTYIGELLNGREHGLGMMTWAEGQAYSGTWLVGKRHGGGTYFWEDGTIYIGDWTNDRIMGQGLYIWPSGDVYIGGCIDGEMHGTGTYFAADGTATYGCWSAGKLNGLVLSQDRTGAWVEDYKAGDRIPNSTTRIR